MVSSASELAAQVKGRSDEEILEEIRDQPGVDAILDGVFRGMAEAFLPKAAEGQAAVIQYDITVPAGLMSYQLEVKDGICSLTRGTEKSPRVTLGLSLADFLRLVTGNLDGMQAFMSGKLKLSGDLMFSQTVQTWFGRPN